MEAKGGEMGNNDSDLNHPLYTYRKRKKQLKMLIPIVFLITFLVIVFYFLRFLRFLDTLDLVVCGTATSVLIGTLLLFAISSQRDMNRTRYHRYYGPTRELTKLLEDYFARKNFQFEKIEDFPYKMPYVPLTVHTINYTLQHFSINIYPAETPGGNYCEIRIYPVTPQNKYLIEEIEKDIFLLIKDKRGWQFKNL